MISIGVYIKKIWIKIFVFISVDVLMVFCFIDNKMFLKKKVLFILEMYGCRFGVISSKWFKYLINFYVLMIFMY